MSRTTIHIEQQGLINPRVLFRLSEPANVPQANILEELDCNVSVPPFTDLASQKLDNEGLTGSLVRDVGTAIYNRLSAHPGVKAALNMIPNAKLDEPCPIFIQMTTHAAEVLPFEALFVPNHRFLALDDRSPIVRVTMPDAAIGVIERLCKVPLRVTAVISAADRQVDEEAEWQALYKTFSESSIDFKLQVLVGRTNLFNMIGDAHDSRVEVARIDGDSVDLMNIINHFEPSVLHFFCHGTTKPAAYLEVATQATHDLGDRPIYLSQDHIKRVSRYLLLVTLNACEGAAPVPDSPSLAMAIAGSGVPVVVGMREAIDAKDANLFTRAFYQELFKELHRTLSSPQAETPNWPALLRAPRDRLALRQGGPPIEAAAAHKRWCLPILYMRAEKLRIRRSGDMEQLGELQELGSLQSKFSKDSPPEMIAEIDQMIAELEKSLPT